MAVFSPPMKTPSIRTNHAISLTASTALALISTAHAADATVDPAKLSAHVKTLASDAFEGRAPASAGEQKTVAYVTEQMKVAGLHPGGDLKNGARAWTQDVPLAQFNIEGPIDLSVTA